MPIDCPSSTGNAVLPKSSTIWRMSLEEPSSVSEKLPVTVASAGVASGYTLTYGLAADHGGGRVHPVPLRPRR